MAIGIAEVDRLADIVVGEPGERDPVARRVGKPAREIGTVRQEQREVVEAAAPSIARSPARSRTLSPIAFS